MQTFDDTFFFTRYFRGIANDQHGALSWIMHYLGIARIVFDSERNTWRQIGNPANPLSAVAWVLIVIYLALWRSGIRQTVSEICNAPLAAYIELYEKREDGRYRFVPYRLSFTNRS